MTHYAEKKRPDGPGSRALRNNAPAAKPFSVHGVYLRDGGGAPIPP
jgi:hypothetical protein